MTAENLALARMVLEGASLARAARTYGKTRGRAWQILRAFCLEQMLHHEARDNSGKLKPLKDLRSTWQTWAMG